jgi:nucleotide-sensitive chloride channel 1A
LRLQEPNVSVSFDPPLPDFGPDDCNRGTLYIIESVLAFISTTGRGFQLEYPSITLHAISRTESGSHLYCQLDEAPTGDQPANFEVFNGDPDQELSEVGRAASNTLNRLFTIRSEGKKENRSLCVS